MEFVFCLLFTHVQLNTNQLIKIDFSRSPFTQSENRRHAEHKSWINNVNQCDFVGWTSDEATNKQGKQNRNYRIVKAICDFVICIMKRTWYALLSTCFGQVILQFYIIIFILFIYLQAIEKNSIIQTIFFSLFGQLYKNVWKKKWNSRK